MFLKFKAYLICYFRCHLNLFLRKVSLCGVTQMRIITTQRHVHYNLRLYVHFLLYYEFLFIIAVMFIKEVEVQWGKTLFRVFCNWNIVGLQCCVSFCDSHMSRSTYIHIHPHPPVLKPKTEIISFQSFFSFVNLWIWSSLCDCNTTILLFFISIIF